MDSRQLLGKAVGAVAFLFAAFSGFLKGIAPPEEATSNFAVGTASLLTLCIFLLLARTKKPTAAKHRLWIGVSTGLTALSLAAALMYWHNRERLVFSYPPENPQGDYIAGTQYTPAASALAGRLNPGQVVAQFGGLPNRHLVWSSDSIERAKTILITNYLLFVLSIAGAVFSLVELGAKH